MKGGGDAVSAARAVLQTGEFDYAWNMQVEDEILKRLEAGGKGRVEIIPGGNIEFIQLQHHRPVDRGRRRARAASRRKHPILTDPAVRAGIGAARRPRRRSRSTSTAAPASPRPTSSTARSASARKNTKWEFNVDKANQILDAAGWKRGADGIRAKDGKKLKFVFQTSINAPRQKTQAIVKQACQKAGIDLELKAVTASVFFSSDVGQPGHVHEVLLRHADVHHDDDAARPRALHGPVLLVGDRRPRRTSGRAATSSRWRNDEYDKAYRAAEGELDPVKRAALFIRMNDLVVAEQVVIPVVNRPRVAQSNAARADDRLGQRLWRSGLVPGARAALHEGSVCADLRQGQPSRL